MKMLTVTIRSVDYSTYEIEVDDDYMPESGDQILEDWFLEGNQNGDLVSSEIVAETVDHWEINEE